MKPGYIYKTDKNDFFLLCLAIAQDKFLAYGLSLQPYVHGTVYTQVIDNKQDIYYAIPYLNIHKIQNTDQISEVSNEVLEAIRYSPDTLFRLQVLFEAYQHVS